MRDHPDHRRLGAYLDGELPEPEAAALRAHLEGCEPCGRLAAQDRALGSALDSALAAPPAALPAGFAARTRARALGRRLPAPPLWWLGVPAPLRFGIAALLAVSALAGARLGRTVRDARPAAAELAAALDSPATTALSARAGDGANPGEAGR